MLPRFQDENQSADTAIKRISETTNVNQKISNIAGRFLERAYDRSGKKCWPIVNTKTGGFDLEFTYTVVGDALESYIHCRKLDRCKALANFIEYRNKVYKREKIGPYASAAAKVPMKETDLKPTINISKKIIRIEEEESTPSLSISPALSSEMDSSTPSTISKKSEQLSTPTPSLHSISAKTSQKLSPFTPISPSPSTNSESSIHAPSLQLISPKTSQRLSPSSPLTPSPSIGSKSPTPSRSLRSMSPQTFSPKLSPSVNSKSPKPSPKTFPKLSPSTRSMTSSKSQKQSTPIPFKQSLEPKGSQKLLPPKPIPLSRSMTPNNSQKLSPASTKESIIPIPSPGLLKKSPSKQSKIKQTPSSSSKFLK